MSGVAKEWLVVIIFFAAFFALTIAEAAWLNKKSGSGLPRAFATALLPNLFAITVGFFVSFMIFAVILAMAWDGSLQTVPGNDATIWAAVIAAILFPLVILTFAKRVALRLSKLVGISGPWVYSFAASLIFLLVVVGLPIAIAMLF